MGENKIKDNVTAPATVEALQKRIELLSHGLESAIDYMDEINKKKWIPRPNALLDDLRAIVGVKGKDK